MFIFTSFWNTTIAGGIYGLFSASIIFFLTTLYNEKTRMKNLRKELFINFLSNNNELVIFLENHSFQKNKSDIDLLTLKRIMKHTQISLLDKGLLRENLEKIKEICYLQGDEFLNRKSELPNLLKKTYQQLLLQKDETI